MARTREFLGRALRSDRGVAVACQKRRGFWLPLVIIGLAQKSVAPSLSSESLIQQQKPNRNPLRGTLPQLLREQTGMRSQRGKVARTEIEPAGGPGFRQRDNDQIAAQCSA